MIDRNKKNRWILIRNNLAVHKWTSDTSEIFNLHLFSLLVGGLFTSHHVSCSPYIIMVSLLSLYVVLSYTVLQGPQTTECAFNIFRSPLDKVERKYGRLPENERLQLKRDTQDMFYFGYDSYMKYAYPKDELNPIYCEGRGPDHDNPWVSAGGGASWINFIFIYLI